VARWARPHTTGGEDGGDGGGGHALQLHQAVGGLGPDGHVHGVPGAPRAAVHHRAGGRRVQRPGGSPIVGIPSPHPCCPGPCPMCIIDEKPWCACWDALAVRNPGTPLGSINPEQPCTAQCQWFSGEICTLVAHKEVHLLDARNATMREIMHARNGSQQHHHLSTATAMHGWAQHILISAPAPNLRHQYKKAGQCCGRSDRSNRGFAWSLGQTAQVGGVDGLGRDQSVPELAHGGRYPYEESGAGVHPLTALQKKTCCRGRTPRVSASRGEIRTPEVWFAWD
jgi:hypothetical protein